MILVIVFCLGAVCQSDRLALTDIDTGLPLTPMQCLRAGPVKAIERAPFHPKMKFDRLRCEAPGRDT